MPTSVMLFVIGTACCLLPAIIWRYAFPRSYKLVHFSLDDKTQKYTLALAMKLAIVSTILLWVAASINIVVIGEQTPEDGMTPTVVLVLGWFLSGYVSMSLVFLQVHRQEFSFQATAQIIFLYAFAIFVMAGNLTLFFGAF